MAVRADGASWVALTGGDRLDLVGETGEILDVMVLPGGTLPTNVCLGPESANELLVTAAFHQALLRIRLPQRGWIRQASGGRRWGHQESARVLPV